MIPGEFYHTYNHANGRENLFNETKNYYFFLGKISLYILPFIRLHAYCLLPNHFHLLISIKQIEELKLLEIFRTFQKLTEEKLQPLIEKKISKVFSNLFSSYTQSYNKVYERKGSLFVPNMKSILIEDESSICKVTYYIHTNPVHHRFVKKMSDWKFSSYKSYLSEAETKLSKNEILNLFGSKEYFIKYHKQPVEPKYKWDV
jgi:REP element-mobilizing transposase RayT